MKQNKKHSPKQSGERHSQHVPQKHSQEGKSHKAIDKQQLYFEIEVGIYEVDKIFEGQGDKLNDGYVVDSLTSFMKVIKEVTYALYADELKEGSDDESDMMHINIINRLSTAIDELELQVSDNDLIEIAKQVLAQVKKAKSAKSPRAYLDLLAKRVKEMGFKSEFLTETDVEDETISLEDIDNIDELGLDEDDELDLGDFRPK